MSAPTFTERDLVKAVSGATRAGFSIGRIDIDRHTGRISLYAVGEAPAVTETDEITQWLEEHDRRSVEGHSQGSR